MGPSILDNNDEVVLLKNDVQETIIDMIVEGSLVKQLKVENDNESEDEYEEKFVKEFADESDKESQDDIDFEDES